MEKTGKQKKSDSVATPRRRLDVLGTLVDEVTMTEAVERIGGWLEERRGRPDSSLRLVVTANPEYVMAARRDPAFASLVNSADLVTPDGVGLIVAGRLLRKPFRGRVTGVALCEELFRRSAQDGWRLFLLGAGPGVAEAAATRLRAQYPTIQIVGTWGGVAGPEGDQESVARIAQAEAEIVLVAYGMGKQDWWAARNLAKCGATVALGVGGVLDYKAGLVPLAPRLVRRLGFEWLYRLYREPWRWRRQLAVYRFGVLVVWTSLRQLATPGKPNSNEA